MKIKTAELKGVQLDWAVAVCEGRNLIFRHAFMRLKAVENNYRDEAGLAFQLNNQLNCILDVSKIPDNSTTGHGAEVHLDEIAYSLDWSQGGPIIEREGIHLRSVRSEGHILHNSWLAKKANGNTGQIECWYKILFGKEIAMWYGSIPLEAAMRCHVANKLGEEVEIPEELI